MAVVRGLLVHRATRFALLLSIFAFGTLGLGACDDDETAMTETEVITSNFGQGRPGRGPTAEAGGSDACAGYRLGASDLWYTIEVLRGVVRCREARRVLKRYGHDMNTPSWSCQSPYRELVECEQPGVGAFAANLECRAPASGERAVCPGF